MFGQFGQTGKPANSKYYNPRKRDDNKQPTPCKYFAQGRCRNGDSCP